MLRNYFKVAWRNLVKHKLFSLINIFGLAAGMTVCLLALMQIKGAYDYDTFHPNANRTFRINTNVVVKNGHAVRAAYSPLALHGYLKKNFPQIEASTRVMMASEDITTDAKTLPAKEAFVDAGFYKMFGFHLAKGSAATGPQTVVLTEETAERFFGMADPVGQRITLGKQGLFTVTGVLARPPHPSHFKFDVLASMPVTIGSAGDWLDETGGYTYVQIREGTSMALLDALLHSATSEAARLRPTSDNTLLFEAQRLTEITPAMKPILTTLDEIPFRNLVAFAAIGAAMLLLAFFNYINLTLARSLDRAREVGVRKVAGAQRRQLVLQFLSESVLTTILAFLMAQLLLRAISGLPTIERLTRFAVSDGKLWAFFGLFTLFTGVVAGWIPAQVLSSFQPARVLKGKFDARLFGGVGLRKAMTVTQFALSLAALVVLTVFYTQSHYMATADYGFNRKRIVTISLPAQSYERTAAAFAGVPGVALVSATSELFGFFGGDNLFIRQEQAEDSLAVSSYSVTPSFIQSTGLHFVAGGNLPVDNTERAASFVVLNEEACRRLGIAQPADAVGKRITLADGKSYAISGVVKDFHYASFQRFIKPLALFYNPAFFRTINLEITAGAEAAIGTRLQAAWRKLYPHQPFEMQWYYKALYDQHLHEDDLMFIGLLTGMALSIACLGLLGMVIYATKARAKEMSVRKIMGAGVWQIVVTVSKDFFVLLLLSVVIGLPIGFFGGAKFLQQYAYRIPLSAGLLASCAAALLLLGAATIGWQTVRTAWANPVKHLRSE